jgi:AcrR family transcriptional regulator
MGAVQIAPVAIRANVAAGTVYRYFPSKADLISELIADVSRDELAAIRRAADAAPGPSSALEAAVTTVAVHVLSQRKLAWGILAEPVDVDVTASRLASRREIAGEIAGRIDAAVRAGHLPAQDTALAATALLGALHESLVGPLAHFAERLDTWREIYGNDDRDDMACPIGEAAAMFGEEPETLLCWLRCGMPFVKAGSWETGDGFLLSPPWVFDWKMSLVCLAKFSGDPISAQKLRVRF